MRQQSLQDDMVNDALQALQRRISNLEHEVRTDQLTGLGNRRALDRYVRILGAAAAGHWWVRIDLDGFKAYQDERKSHAAGDMMLIQFATWLQAAVRGHTRDDARDDPDVAKPKRRAGAL